MIHSKTEQILQAVLARLETLPTAKVERNTAVPEKIPTGGLIVLRDGNPGEPDMALGGFGGAYYSHDIEIELYIEEGDVDINDATYSRPASTQRLLVTHDTAGAAGNAFTQPAPRRRAASAATASGSTLTGGGYSHVFASGNDTLPSYSIEVDMGQVPAFFMHTGVMLNSIALEFQRSGAAAAESGVLEGLAPREGG